MKLQIAVDVADTKRILEIADMIHDVIDIYEVGTPVIMREGVAPVRALKEKYPQMTVLADSKIMDGGALEATYLCEAGADIITVLAVSDNTTIREVIDTAHGFGSEVLVDLMCVRDIPARSREVEQMGADYVCVHTGTDMQKLGRTPLRDLKEIVSAIDSAKAGVAGGIKMETIDQYKALRPGIIIAGSALYSAPDIRQAVIEMKGAIGV
ncbi:MAG: orotidine 5'-phosphate decarboxylase [Clostridia bacterium]|nr:orotidine 5'-phosphate decarboxylase [Clostridia bacterium]